MAKPAKAEAIPAKGDSEPAKADDSALRSLTQVAKFVGLPPAVVVEATKEGFLTADSKRRYHLGQAIRDLFKYAQARWEKLPVYENMHRCAAATGIPLTVIKSGKRFAKLGTGNRIELARLLPAIHDASKGQDWRALREKCDALRAEAELEKARGETLDKEKVGLAIRQTVSAFWHALDRAADLELPPVLKGKDEAAIRDELHAMIKRMKKTIFTALEEHGCEDKEQKAEARQRG